MMFDTSLIRRFTLRTALRTALLTASAVASAQSPCLPDAVATQIAAGGLHTCALTTAGTALCWGDNYEGQLGNNSTTDSAVPVAVSSLSSGVVAITAGFAHTCALTTAGGAQCWGNNANGQLGNNSTTNSHVPVAVINLTSGVVAIAEGYAHTCALTSAGAVQCWGLNNVGQLGNNTLGESHVPVAVSGLASGVVAIAAGDNHTCALTTAGAVQCWGYNSNGQLGNGTVMDSHVPGPVSGLTSGVAAIAAGAYHTCALTTSGGAQCWGYNSNGQLGNGTVTDSHVPGTVSDLTSDVVAIQAGYSHTCALTTSGGAQCWGNNFNGELGNYSHTDSHVPVAVTGLGSGAVAITGGISHTCALTTSGGAQCWGHNGNGQLGNNFLTDTEDSDLPVPVCGLGNDVIFANGFDN